MVLKVIRNSRDILPAIQYIPLTLFLIIARYYEFSLNGWVRAFNISGAASLIVMVIKLIYKDSIEPLLFGVNLFFSTFVLAYYIPIPRILELYSHHKGVAFMANICLADVFTTIFSSRGFIGVSGNRIQVVYHSLLLLALASLGLLWSILSHERSILMSAGIPFIVIKIAQLQLRRKIKK